MANFTDAKGDEWQLRLTTPTFLRISRECNLSLARLLGVEIRADEIIDMVWIACAEQARARGCDREQFINERLTPEIIPEAVKAGFAAISEAFPKIANKGAGEGASPLVEAARAALGKYAI